MINQQRGWTGDSCWLIRLTRRRWFPRPEVEFPTFDPAVDIVFEDNPSSIFEVHLHVSIADRSEYIETLSVAVGEEARGFLGYIR